MESIFNSIPTKVLCLKNGACVWLERALLYSACVVVMGKYLTSLYVCVCSLIHVRRRSEEPAFFRIAHAHHKNIHMCVLHTHAANFTHKPYGFLAQLINILVQNHCSHRHTYKHTRSNCLFKNSIWFAEKWAKSHEKLQIFRRTVVRLQ